MPRRPRRDFLTLCRTVYESRSRADNTPYWHICELREFHTGWHLCWCGSAFTERGVVSDQRVLDLQGALKVLGSHVPL